MSLSVYWKPQCLRHSAFLSPRPWLLGEENPAMQKLCRITSMLPLMQLDDKESLSVSLHAAWGSRTKQELLGRQFYPQKILDILTERILSSYSCYAWWVLYLIKNRKHAVFLWLAQPNWPQKKDAPVAFLFVPTVTYLISRNFARMILKIRDSYTLKYTHNLLSWLLLNLCLVFWSSLTARACHTIINLNYP